MLKAASAPPQHMLATHPVVIGSSSPGTLSNADKRIAVCAASCALLYMY